GLVERARRIGELMLGRLRELAAKYDIIGDVRGRGAMVAIELVKDADKTPNPEALGKVLSHAHKQGLILLSAGTYGNVIRMLPPLVISDELLNEGLDILDEAFARL
ncbi:aminotransferase class III-fold pyridoxal phosphate-dependent enzyme, partial [Nocardiopsis lucentensis]